MARRVGDVQDAEDIASLTFEKTLQALGNFQWKDVSFSSWLYRTATDLVTDRFRRSGRRKQVSFEELEGMLAVSEQ